MPTHPDANRFPDSVAVDLADILTQLLPHLDDDDVARAATVGVLRAQGRRLRSSPALGALLAQPFALRAGLDPTTIVAAFERRSARGGSTWGVVGDPARRSILFDRPGHGVAIADTE